MSKASPATVRKARSNEAIQQEGETVALLHQWQDEQIRIKTALGNLWNEAGYIFTQENGLPMHPDSVNGWRNKFSKRHGLRQINPHAFRHSMASILINNGTDILSVSRRLGHTRASTTLNFYGHILQEADARSSHCIADVLLRKKDEENDES